MAEESAPTPVVSSNGRSPSIVASFVERLSFYFSNSNLRHDRWMRDALDKNAGSITVDTLMKFNTIKSISTDKDLLAQAATSDELKELIVYDAQSEKISRVTPYNHDTMGDGTPVSLFVKNVPLTQPPEGKEEVTEEEDAKKEDAKEEDAKEEDTKYEDAKKEDAKKEDAKKGDAEPFRQRYAVTRDEIKALFEPYGKVGIVQLRYGRKPHSADDKHNSANSQSKGYRHGESYPLGVAFVEFESKEGFEKACDDLICDETDSKGDDEDPEKEGEKAGEKAQTEPKKVLEIKGNKLKVKKLRKFKAKRKRDSRDDGEKQEETPFEPIKLEWTKGCIIFLTNLSATSCDRESIREAVSDVLKVSRDVKSSGLYVDYNRGESSGHLRVVKGGKSDEMNELVEKLTEGSIKIKDEKVDAKILEGEEEEAYYKKLEEFLNNRKKMQHEERTKRRRSGGHQGRRRRY